MNEPDRGTNDRTPAGVGTPTPDPAETRIGFALTRSANRTLLADLLSAYDLVDVVDEVPTETDLCLADEAGLDRSRAALEAWQDADPARTPVLLLVEESARNPWQRHRSESNGLISAIQEIPAPRAAIAARVESLLETRRYAEELAFEHELTERIFETSPLAKTVLDTEGNIVRANDRAEEVLRLSKSEITTRRYDAPAWRSVDENGDPLPSEELPFSQVMATGEPVRGYEHAIESPDGELVWLSINVAPIFGDEGEVEYAVATMEDITDAREQALELDRQVDLFQQAQELARVGGWEYDVAADEWWETDAVDAVLDTATGSDRLDQFVSRVHPADRPVVADRFERAIEHGEPYDLEFRIETRAGDERWIRSRAEPQFADGELRRVRGTVQDVTTQKAREQALERMTYAVDNAPIGVTVTDPALEDNPITYVNESFLSLTGYDRDEVLGRNCRFLQGPETDPETVRRVRRAIDSAESVSVTIRNYRKNGTPFWNRLDIGPVFDADGNVRNFIGFQQDVTERIERQRQLQKIDRYLRHNLRNEMNIILGMTGLIRDDSGSPIRERAESVLDHGESLVSTMDKARAITELLREEPAPTSLELSSLLAPVVERVREESPSAEISTSVPDSVTVTATEGLATAVEELLRNAVQYNDTETPRIEVSARVRDGMVAITVTDNGPGIPEMEVDVLTLAEEETAVYHGQGLGLWLVYLISQQLDGTVEFSDNDPRGSVVTLSVPRGSDPT